MRTLGIDLAADPKRTAACAVAWNADGTVIEAPTVGHDDDSLLEAIARADRVGIDAPFGWPDEFVEAVVAHRERRGWPPGAERARLRFRETDRAVAALGNVPLSVSSDRIAVTAMRCAHLLELVGRQGEPVDRAGGGKVVEVYPAAALRSWGIDPRGYKRDAGAERRSALLEELESQLGWLDALPRPVREACARSDDALDALVAALVARAAALGLTDPPPSEHAERAAREGWIHLPRSPLAALASTAWPAHAPPPGGYSTTR